MNNLFNSFHPLLPPHSLLCIARMAVKGLVAQLHGLLAGIQAGCPGFEPTEGDGNIGTGNIGIGFMGYENMGAGAVGAGNGGGPANGPSDTTHYNGVYLPAMSRGPR